MKFALLCFAFLLNSAFAFAASSSNSTLSMTHTTEAFVVSGIAANCSDKRSGTSPNTMSVMPDFFALNTFKLNWNSSNVLVPSAIVITIDDPRVQSYQCQITGQLLEDTFGGTMFNGGTIDMNSPMNGAKCSIGCGGITRLISTANKSFSTTANVEFLGYEQSREGAVVKPVHSSSQIKLNFF